MKTMGDSMIRSNKFEIMYDMIGKLHEQNLGIVFKGALVLEHIVSTQTDLLTWRTSNDFDIDWSKDLLSDEQFVKIFENTLKDLGYSEYKVKCVKTPAKSSNGVFEVKHVDDISLSFSIDLVRKRNIWSIIYTRPNGILFRGSTLAKIFCDKLAVISSNSVINRPQDIYGLYRISHIRGLSTNELWHLLDEIGRKIYNFELFLSESELEFGPLYESYIRYSEIFIEHPPDFCLMYGRVRDFCGPFFTKKREQMEWVPGDSRWTLTTHTLYTSYFNI